MKQTGEHIMVREAPGEGKQANRRVVINVGGNRHETYLSTLKKLPDTRLALLADLQEADDAYDVDTNEFFFDRNPRAFSVIMHYLRTDELHVDHSLCGNVLKPELAFWGVEEHEIEVCCWAEYSKFTEHRQALREMDENFTSYIDESSADEKSSCKRFANSAWRFLEEPTSSTGAKVFAVLSMFFVCLSICIFVLETHTLFQVDEKSGIGMSILLPGEISEISGNPNTKCGCENKNLTKELWTYSPVTHPVLRYIDYVCAAYFLLEVIIRFSFAPNKIKFWRDALNIIDVVCLIPHFTSIILVSVNYVNSAVFPIKPFMVLRVVRVLRIFKLMKHYNAFKILIYTIKVSTKELLLMVVFLMTGVLTFASIIHYVEKQNFPNIPIAIWWAIVTMTTVGYGDKYPVDYGGYIVGCLCVISGVLVIAFTVPIVVNNFSLYYSHAQTRINLPQRKRRRKLHLPVKRNVVASESSTSGELESARTSVSMISLSSHTNSACTNDLNVNEAQPPDKKTVAKSKNVEWTTHGHNPAKRVTSPVDNEPPESTLQRELQLESEKLIEAMHAASEKRDMEKRRQEYKFKLKRERRLKEQTAAIWKSHKKSDMDLKTSND